MAERIDTTPSLQELAVEAGMSINSTSRELGRIASSVAYTEFLPLSPYDALRALLRIQRDMRAQQNSAPDGFEKVPA